VIASALFLSVLFSGPIFFLGVVYPATLRYFDDGSRS